ncbi:MAG: hypothetical protein HY906_07655 [Deltaproteobacteria bacterium]|nr:hypothetical protein [Deltaproteobacteria bacterium]
MRATARAASIGRVGRNATIQAWLARWTPDRMLDGMLEREIGLPRRA